MGLSILVAIPALTPINDVLYHILLNSVACYFRWLLRKLRMVFIVLNSLFWDLRLSKHLFAIRQDSKSAALTR